MVLRIAPPMGEPPARSIQHNGMEIAVAYEVPEGFRIVQRYKEITAPTIEDALKKLMPGAEIEDAS